MDRLPIKVWAKVAIVTTALASTPAYAADGIGVCGTIRLGEMAVALLDNQPIVNVFANSATVLLLLDTGAEATVLTPAAMRHPLRQLLPRSRLHCRPHSRGQDQRPIRQPRLER